MQRKIVEFNDVCFNYEKAEDVIKKLNIQIFENDFIGIKGYNGAGKTTFIRLLLNIIKPDVGEIYFADDILFSGIGYVRQNIDSRLINFPASVMEVVMLGLYPKIGKFKFFNKEHKKLAINALEKVGMQEYKNRKISDLSGGQRQKVLIAKALSSMPKFLVLDEPDSGIDEESTDMIFQLLGELNKSQNLTILVISHNIEVLEKYTKKVLQLKEGKLF